MYNLTPAQQAVLDRIKKKNELQQKKNAKKKGKSTLASPEAPSNDEPEQGDVSVSSYH